ncbi:sodium:solute symporter family transporter [Oleiharenicola lentus]|uniref:sodium:solute symporter family transporter n=1 Tax=Oleiharenicola lentus TaxID=2508720 RepID=UPI003F668C8E
MHFLDYTVIALYAVGIAVLGLLVGRRQKNTEDYFTANRSIPGWVVSFTLMGTIIGTGTFVGHPGTSFQKGLIFVVPHMILPVVLLLVAKFIVPFYRRVVRMSAYEYIGQRFGLGSRLYTSFGFLADRVFDIGVTLFTTAIAVNVLTGWELRSVIVGVAAFTVAYTMLGGIKAVVWTDVVQGTVLILGGTFVLARLLFAPEAGAPFAVVGEAWRGGRLTLGSWDFSWSSLFNEHTTTAWLFTLTAAVQWARRYVSDQHLVQRYLLARTDAEASRAAVTGALICVPVFFTFMSIGACFYGFFTLAKVPVPELGDSIMPYFMMHYLPVGVLGLVSAAILAAAMSTISSDLTSVATVVTTDYFSNFLPKSSERARLLFGRLMVVAGGALAAIAATLLIPEKGAAPVMERAIVIAAILSGGTLGLFCLGFLTRKATRLGCTIGIVCCLVFTAWAVATEPRGRMIDLGFNFEMNPILIGVFGHAVLFITGYVASLIFGGWKPENVENLTFHSLSTKKAVAA